MKLPKDLYVTHDSDTGFMAWEKPEELAEVNVDVEAGHYVLEEAIVVRTNCEVISK